MHYQQGSLEGKEKKKKKKVPRARQKRSAYRERVFAVAGTLSTVVGWTLSITVLLFVHFDRLVSFRSLFNNSLTKILQNGDMVEVRRNELRQVNLFTYNPSLPPQFF